MVARPAEFYHFILRALLEPITQADGKSPVLDIGVVCFLIIVDAAYAQVVRGFYEHFIKMVADPAENGEAGIAIVFGNIKLHGGGSGNAVFRGLLPAGEGNTHYRPGRNAEMVPAACIDIKAQQRSNVNIVDMRFYFAGIAQERLQRVSPHIVRKHAYKMQGWFKRSFKSCPDVEPRNIAGGLLYTCNMHTGGVVVVTGLYGKLALGNG